MHLQMFRKICLFAPLFVQYVFVTFSTNFEPIGTKQVGVASGRPRSWFDGLMEAPGPTWESNWVQKRSYQN